MTISGTLKRIRTNMGYKQIEFAKILEIDAATYRKYENGQLIPATKTLQKIADALQINIHTLSDADLDATVAMIRLFQISKSFQGNLFTGKEIKKSIKDKTFNEDTMYLTFSSLSGLLSNWYNFHFEEYKQALKDAENIKDLRLRQDYLDAVQAKMEMYMDIYPNSEPDRNLLDFANKMEAIRDYISSHSLNDTDNPVSKEEEKRIQEELNKMLLDAKKIMPET